jgi:uncharacterized lipoprotein YajG
MYKMIPLLCSCVLIASCATPNNVARQQNTARQAPTVPVSQQSIDYRIAQPVNQLNGSTYGRYNQLAPRRSNTAYLEEIAPSSSTSYVHQNTVVGKPGVGRNIGRGDIGETTTIIDRSNIRRY